MIWTDCFKLIRVHPGRIVTPRHGILDFSDPKIPIAKCKELFEEDFPYLQITPRGLDYLYPIPKLVKLKPRELPSPSPVKRMHKRKA